MTALEIAHTVIVTYVAIGLTIGGLESLRHSARFFSAGSRWDAIAPYILKHAVLWPLLLLWGLSNLLRPP
jgi:hypothetical protein